MKKFLNILIIASFSIAGCYTPGHVAQSDNYNYSDDYNNTELSYQTFYNELQPYGNWINYPQYGNVWQPYVRNGFRPYETGGRWVSTVDGWAWASDYNWGWAPFHYGRWFYDQSIGWAWVPGYEWAPAWVTWGQYNNYYAWAPLAPGINISFGNTWRAPASYWSFVPRNYINYSNLSRYTTRNNYNTNVNNITIINNYNSYNQREYYHRGPDYQEVRRFTGKPINPVDIASTNKPGSSRVVNQQFKVFRPSISPNLLNNNSAIRQTLPRKTRQYNGAVSENSQTKTGINNRIRKNPNLNNGQPSGNRDVFSNGVNNGSNTVTQQDIDNTNRRLQQQQVERARDLRTQRLENKRSIPSNPAVNGQPAFPNERTIQRPAFPQQNERIMRQPQAPSMPNRTESRGANPLRSTPTGRPGNLPQKP